MGCLSGLRWQHGGAAFADYGTALGTYIATVNGAPGSFLPSINHYIMCSTGHFNLTAKYADPVTQRRLAWYELYFQVRKPRQISLGLLATCVALLRVLCVPPGCWRRGGWHCRPGACSDDLPECCADMLSVAARAGAGPAV